MTSRWAGVPELLSALEDLELPLLSWGVVDGFLSEDDVSNAILDLLISESPRLGADTPSLAEYQAYLEDNGLIIALPGEAEPRFRTRFAEYLRNLRKLRQLFPPGDENRQGWWLSGAPLVADYRLKVQPRRYPVRDISPETLSRRLQAGTIDWSAECAAVVGSLMAGKLASEFQAAASESILKALETQRPRAVIVTAGTGSGKTLCFYLPALMHIAPRLERPPEGVHTLALYPRNELLRDQARECVTAALALAVDGPGRRPLRIGLLYGSTPWNVGDLARSSARLSWSKAGRDVICPYFPCPTASCAGDLRWRTVDQNARKEVLHCVACGLTTPDGMLALTRDSMLAIAPDVLFSTTEMLSKQATDHRLGPLMGWSGGRGIPLVLLDEAHTYSGVHGAQVALMLRRWQNAQRRSGHVPVFVGLSATLKDAAAFFSRLTGVDERGTEAIGPREEHLRATGREYGLVLRGDPISGTSLLSTTIQAAMLSGRVLDREPGIFGSSLFIFTDDLDVTNRLHFDLADAEGRPSRFGAATKAVLADLRDPTRPHAHSRFTDGQSWELSKRLGRLGAPLKVGVTSSQRRGVDSAADVIVATASLEVGFNDPRVGLVLQHKAPRDSAAFIQRKGRAGRDPAMRPIACVVLSDYGRDHVAYQTYERLLDPEVTARRLPIGNRYVLKIQATHALLDWITYRTGVDMRRSLVKSGLTADVIRRATRALVGLQEDEADQAHFQRFLQFSLGIGEDEALAVMWDEPRSLMFSVIPTAVRRVGSGWSSLPSDPDPAEKVKAPLPEFMTNALFDPLNTPDVELLMPAAFSVDDAPRMEISRALREALPGRVSRRFGYARSDHRTWLPLPASGSSVELSAFVTSGQRLGSWPGPSGREHLVVRPLALQLAEPPPDVADASTARPIWQSQFLPPDTAAVMDIPTPSRWDNWIASARFTTHANGSQMTIRRMIVGANCELALTVAGRYTRRRQTVDYVHEGEPAAVGFEGQFDAMMVDVALPPDWLSQLTELAASPPWRVRAFHSRVAEDPRLEPVTNPFQRAWLADIYLHAFALECLAGRTPEEARNALSRGVWARDLTTYLSVVYRQDPAAIAASPSKLAAALEELTRAPEVRRALDECAEVLTAADIERRTADLLERAAVDTLAAALSAAAREMLPDSDDTDLIADVVRLDAPRRFRVILSETSIGGLGLIEQLQLRYARDPRWFWDAISRVSGPSDYEEVDLALRELASRLVRPGETLASEVADYRAAQGARQAEAALTGVISAWTTTIGPPSHLAVATFAARALRPGATRDIDLYVASLLRQWTQWEEQAGIEVDTRTVAFAAARGLLQLPATLDADTVFSLLWLRGRQARAQRLAGWQPYVPVQIVERLVLESLTARPTQTVDVTEGDWMLAYQELLREHGEIELVASTSERRAMAQAIRNTGALAVERGPLRVYGRVSGLTQRLGQLRTRVSIAEDLQ